MPDFLGRLVERTFGLAPVVQPVIGSMLAPMPAVKSDYIQGLARDSESVSNQDSIHIDSAQERIAQHPPATNPGKPSNKIPDNQSAFTSVQRQLRQPLRQNDSNSLEQVEPVPSRHVSDLDTHTLSAKPAQDEEPLYQVDSNNPGTSKPQYLKNRNDRMSSTKPMHHEEPFHGAKPDSLGHVEPGLKDFADVQENRKLSRQRNRNILTSEPELPYENLSAGKHPGKSFSRQGEPFINSVDTPVDEPLMKHIPDSSLPHESLSSPIIAGRQYSKRVKNPNDNATLEHMGNMLIDRHAVEPKPPPIASTIKVTIGRIEVRAVTPPQAPQPQTSPPRQHPILSLDDYLKQYNG